MKIVEQIHLWFDFLVVVTICLVAMPIIRPIEFTYMYITILKILTNILLLFVIYFVVRMLVEEIKVVKTKETTKSIKFFSTLF